MAVAIILEARFNRASGRTQLIDKNTQIVLFEATDNAVDLGIDPIDLATAIAEGMDAISLEQESDLYDMGIDESDLGEKTSQWEVQKALKAGGVRLSEPYELANGHWNANWQVSIIDIHTRDVIGRSAATSPEAATAAAIADCRLFGLIIQD